MNEDYSIEISFVVIQKLYLDALKENEALKALPPIPTNLEVKQDLERLRVSEDAKRGYTFFEQVKKLYTEEAA